jgi:predicted ribosome quality control (RQC) complex YloA/Tae2 family protein
MSSWESGRVNAPFLRRLAPVLGAALAGRRARYALARKPAAADGPVLLLRMEPPGGTLLLSLRRSLPCVALLAEGESPEGAEDEGAARLTRALGERAASGAETPAVDRSLVVGWEGGLAMRIDFLPPRPSLHLVEEGRVLFSLPEGSASPSGRGLPPLPGSERPDLFHFDPETIREDLANEEEARAFLRGAVRALPPEWAEEVLFRAGFAGAPPPLEGPALIDAWKDLLREYRDGDHGEGRAALYAFRGRIVPSAVRLRSLGEPIEECAGPLEAAAAWWKRSDDAARREDALREIRAAAKGERKKLLRLLGNLRADLEGAERAPLYRRQAEVLSIHFRSVAKGAALVRLPDPYDGSEIAIPLDPTKSARRNIERLFQLARKGERGAEVVRGRAAEAKKRLASIDALLAEIESAAGAEEAEALLARAEPLLRTEKRAPAWRERVRKPRDRELPARPRTYTITGGYTVLVGRDNKENDLLTLKIARPGDLWFHAGQAAGSHVVLLRDDPKKTVPQGALLEAAAIAAWYSKAKHASKVPVVYTEKRYVRKPRGWPPGKVTCTREKTLFVEPGLPPGGQGLPS